MRCFGSALARRGLPRQLAAGQRGFTLLELTIAMVFVALLVSGIALSISTGLNVWRRSLEAAELNQEARAVMALLSRDIRGAYLGLDRMNGWFIAAPSAESEGGMDRLEVCTESSAPTRLALLPEELRQQWSMGPHAPVSDYVLVRYEMQTAESDYRPARRPGALSPAPPLGQDAKPARSGVLPHGLYRTTWVAPLDPAEMSEQIALGPARTELISTSVVGLRFRCYGGQEWSSAWHTTLQDRRLPGAVAVELTLLDARGYEHDFQTMVPIAAR